MRWWGTALGAAAVVAGAWLTIRPLTALLILIPLGAAAVSVGVAWRLHRAHRDAWAWGALGAGAVATGLIAWQISAVTQAVPVLAALAWVAGAVSLAWGVRRPNGWGARLSRVLFALACLGAAGLFWVWPDAATLLTAAGLSLALAVGGIFLIVRSWRPRPEQPRPARRWTVVLKQVASIPALAVVVAAAVGSGVVLGAVPKAGDLRLDRPDSRHPGGPAAGHQLRRPRPQRGLSGAHPVRDHLLRRLPCAGQRHRRDPDDARA